VILARRKNNQRGFRFFNSFFLFISFLRVLRALVIHFSQFNMQVFIYEYTSAAGIADRSRSLKSEGWAMLSAAVEDFSRLSNVEVITIVSESGKLESAGRRVRQIKAHDEETIFRELAGQSDYTLVIAPEFDAILATRCQWVEEVRGRLLGPCSAAVRLTGDKLTLAELFRTHRIPTLPCQVLAGEKFTPSVPFPLVCKPRFGAGSLATFLVRDAQQLARCKDLARAERWEGEMIVQPFVAGQAASVAFLIGPNQRLALLPAAQNLSADGRFHYLGGTMPLPDDLGRRAIRLAAQAIDVVSGLRGYVGVDLVMGPDDDGSQDWVIEINPRLTTSYVGLRRLAQANLADIMLRLAKGESVPPLEWHPGPVHFQANGTVA
jgi:tyramine---L-glutamate ligase